MTPYSANPVMYILGILILGGFLLFAAFSAIDKLGLDTQRTIAIVTGKHFTVGGQTYVTNIVNGKPLVQSQGVPDAYIASLDINGEPTAAAVQVKQYESLQKNQRVQVVVQRTRLTGTLEVLEVTH